VEDELDELGVRLRDLGEQRLKDLDRPVRLYQLESPGLSQQFPPLRTLDAEEAARRRRRIALGAAAAVAVLAAIAGVVLATRSGGGVLTATPNSVAVIDAASNRLERVVPVGRTPTSIAFGVGAVWVLNSDEQTVTRLDPRSGAVERTDPVPTGASELAVGAGALWVATNRRTVARLDPQSGLGGKTYSVPLPGTLAAGPRATQVAADADSAWAGGPGVVVRLPPGRQEVEDAFCCGGLAIGERAVFATDAQGVLKIDPASGTKAGHFSLGFLGNDVAAGAGSVWIPNQRSNQVWRLDPNSGAIVDVVKVGRNPGGVALGAGAVWVASADGTVARIDPGSGAVVETIHVGATPNDVVVGNGRVWVTVD
jgi:streptogramin lyase